MRFRPQQASDGLVCCWHATTDESERVIFFICGAKLTATERQVRRTVQHGASHEFMQLMYISPFS